MSKNNVRVMCPECGFTFLFDMDRGIAVHKEAGEEF